MAILDEDVQRVRESTDIVGLISEHLALKRVGRRYQGLCPFHQEKSPSFSVNPEMGLFYCFGCSKSGDAITFVREIEHLDFVQAVERLAQRANITLRYDDHNQSKERGRKERLHEAVQAAIDFYHQRLLSAPDAGPGRSFLRSRGFEGDAARRFQLGWSPDSMDELSAHLQNQKFSRKDLTDAGLAFVNRINKLQDQFRARLMFPIFDGQGKAVGFGGRALDGNGPKYKNSAESQVYHKSRVLYGLNWAKSEIVARGYVVICEGYTDVMGMHLAGVPTAVATCGTALADEHFQILKNLTRKVVLAYDSDAAGQAAAQRWYHWEQQFDLELVVASLPAGKDPGDLWREDPEGLRQAVAQAKQFMQFRIERALVDANLNTPEGRSRAAEKVLPILREHPSEIVRDGYIQQVEGITGVSASWFKERIRGRVQPNPSMESEPTKIVERVDPRELEALRLAVHMPELVAHRLDVELFEDSATREAFEALVAADTFQQALKGASEQVQALLQRLAVEEPDVGEQLEVYVAELSANLTEQAARRLQKELVANGDEHAFVLNQLIDTLVSQRIAGDWKAVEHSTQQLLHWMLTPVSG